MCKEIEMINKYKKGVQLEALSKEYKMGIVEIHKIFQKHNQNLTREDWGKVSSKKQRFNISKEELIDMYITQNKTRQEVAKHFNCSDALIKKRCSEWGIRKRREKIIENTSKTLIERYGTDKLSEVNREQREATNKKRYGGKTPFESFEIQSKIAKNKIISVDEAVVARILEREGYNYEMEYAFNPEDYSDRVVIIFDFAIFSDDDKVLFLIEVDGFYHHAHNSYNDETFDSIIKHKEYDLDKLRFCKSKKIPLLTINEIKAFETEDELTQLICNFSSRIGK